MRGLSSRSSAPYLLGAGAVFVVACATLFPSGQPCQSDNDCKLERICEAGRCLWPEQAQSPRPRTPTPPPAAAGKGTPSAAQAETAAGATGIIQSTTTALPVAAAHTMHRLDPTHRGQSPYKLPGKRPVVKWTYETLGPIVSSPAVGPGFIVVGSQDNRVHFVTPEGRMHWIFPTGDMVFGSPAVTASGVVLIGSDDDHLYALDAKEKKELWHYRLGNCRSGAPGPDNSRCDADGGPTLGPDGSIYIGGDAVYALDQGGRLRWRYPSSGVIGHVATAPALLPDGTVVVGSQDNLIYGLNPNGSKRWEFRTGDDVESTPAIGEDGTIYVGSDDGKLYALTPEGKLRWAFDAGNDLRAGPAIGRDGTIYVGGFNGSFFAVRPDGTLDWTFQAGDRILSSALVDAGGAILFGAEDDRLYALESSGQLRWSVELGGDVDSSPALGSDGTIFVGADDRKLHALR